MATATKTAKGFKAACPFCGCSDDDSLSLVLSDMSFVCGGCDENYSIAEAMARVTETLAAWQKIARFVEIGRELAGE